MKKQAVLDFFGMPGAFTLKDEILGGLHQT